MTSTSPDLLPPVPDLPPAAPRRRLSLTNTLGALAGLLVLALAIFALMRIADEVHFADIVAAGDDAGVERTDVGLRLAAALS